MLVGHTGIEPVQHIGIGFADRFASLAKYCPLVRGDQYRELVCAVGIEPTTSCAQDTRATTALRTEIVGGGRSLDFIIDGVYQALVAHIKQCL